MNCVLAVLDPVAVDVLLPLLLCKDLALVAAARMMLVVIFHSTWREIRSGFEGGPRSPDFGHFSF